MRSRCAFLLLVGTLFLGLHSVGSGQEPAESKPQESQEKSQRLTIGDPAPPLDIETWVTDGNGMFMHTTRFEKGQVYVIDFWHPSWRGSLMAMPLLSKLQAKYGDQLQVISVAGATRARPDQELKWLTAAEADAFLDEDFPNFSNASDPPETYREVVENYSITTDPDGSVFNDYMGKSGRITVPCCFVVGKDGKLDWIGSTLELEKPLEQIIDGDWDRGEFAKKYDQEMDAVQARSEASREVVKLLPEFQKRMRNSPDEAMDYLAEQSEAAENPLVSEQLAVLRLQLLIGMMHEKAPEALVEFADKFGSEENSGELNDLVWGIYERHEARGDVSSEMLKACRHAAEVAVKFDPTSGAVNDTVAHFVYLDGDLDKAIEWQKKAVANAEGREADLQPFLDKLLKEKETGEKALTFGPQKKPNKEKADF